MTDRELLQMALDALEEYCEHNAMLRPIERRDALRAALAQPEPEPVAWMEIEKYIDEDNLWDSRKILRDYDNGLGEPLYTTPPQREWVGLTDEEMFAALVQVDPLTKRLAPGFEHYARAIESKLKEKNGG